jgi:hypothetical protein
MKKEKKSPFGVLGTHLILLHETERASVYQPPFYCGALQLRTHLSHSNYHKNMT